MRAHSPVEDVLALARLMREQEADLVVALGGGSVIDGSKVACPAMWRGITEAGSLIEAAASRRRRPSGMGRRPARASSQCRRHFAAEFGTNAGYTDIAAGGSIARSTHGWCLAR